MAGDAPMTGEHLDALAESLFWQDRQAESLAAWREAYSAHVAAGDIERAAHAVWRIFCEHFLVGEAAVAAGWLERGRRHAAEAAGSAADGFIAVASSLWATASGDVEAAVAEAQRARQIGESIGSADVTAMALATEGRALVDLRRVADGMSALDDAMVSVINDDLAPLYTGWIYCTMLATCHDLADLRRAAEWTDAALRWCERLGEGQLYPGLCRIHRVELDFLRGDWTSATAQARQACEEITAHDPRFAGEAYYLMGEIRRATGDLEGAEDAYRAAQHLGRDPHPGLAEIRRAQGQPAVAVRMLKVALESASAPFHRAQVLAALARSQVDIGDLDAATAASADLTELAAMSSQPLLSATAAAVAGEVCLAAGDVSGALPQLREALVAYMELGLPYDAAHTRVAIASAARLAGDDDTAAAELEAAAGSLRRLGAPVAVEPLSGRPLAGTPAAGLSPRELEVLTHVAAGLTNRQIGEELFISEHTVARHLSNIYTKLGVRSRAAATSLAHEHHLV